MRDEIRHLRHEVGQALRLGFQPEQVGRAQVETGYRLFDLWKQEKDRRGDI